MSLLNSTLFKVYADSEKEIPDENLSNDVCFDEGHLNVDSLSISSEKAPFTSKRQQLPERIERGPLAPTNLTRGISLVDSDFDWAIQGSCGPVFLQKSDLSLETMFKRQRAVEGVCGKKLEPSEQRINMMSLSTSEKVRSFQKTKSEDSQNGNPDVKISPQETPGFDCWLRSPDITAEAQLRKADADGVFSNNAVPMKRRTPGASIQWKAKKQSVDLLDDCNKSTNSDPGNANDFSREQKEKLSEKPFGFHSESFMETMKTNFPGSDFSLSDLSMTNQTASNHTCQNIPETQPMFKDVATPGDLTSGGATSDTPTPDNTTDPDASAYNEEPQIVEPQNRPETSNETSCFSSSAFEPSDIPTPQKVVRQEITWSERIRRLTPRFKTPFWPQQCERIQNETNTPITVLVDYLENQMGNGLKTLSFCGNRPGSGCSTIMLCCARELARRGRKTLIVDGHLEHPDLAQKLGFEHRNENSSNTRRWHHGWESLFFNPDDSNNDAISNKNLLWTLEKNLDLLPLSPDIEHDIMENDAGNLYAGWCRVFREQYEIVLIDSGCFDGFSDDQVQRKKDEFQFFGVKKYFMILGGEPLSQNDSRKIDVYFRRYGIAKIGVAENYS